MVDFCGERRTVTIRQCTQNSGNERKRRRRTKQRGKIQVCGFWIFFFFFFKPCTQRIVEHDEQKSSNADNLPQSHEVLELTEARPIGCVVAESIMTQMKKRVCTKSSCRTDD